MLAYLTFSRFIYILLIFPVIQKGGRKLYHRYHVHKVGLPKTERSRLLQRASYRKREQKSEANHFDVSGIASGIASSVAQSDAN